MRRFVPAPVLVALVLALAGSVAAGTTPSPAGAQAGGDVVVTGHGYGHGRGLGQYGAYGYAKDRGWSYQQITDHFYGGTTLGGVGDDEIDVLFKAYRNNGECAATPRGCWTIAYLESGGVVTSLDGQLAGGPTADRSSIAVQWLGGDRWQLYEGTTCVGYHGGAFVDRGTFTATEVVVAPADPAPDQRVELLALCETTGHRYVRGAVVADSFATATDPAVRQRTMNRVRIESYLRSVIPSESPSSWGGNGTAPGMHALRAQAVAARSYALTKDTRWEPADTCEDIFCQVYRGFGFNAGGAVTLYETTNGDLATAQTAGQVRRMANGGVARTEFSSSTGGHTAGGAFPAVPDEGDSVAANPNHDWTAALPVAEVEARLDARAGRDLGDFGGFVVTERNGLGDDGGRVLTVRADLAGGSVSLTGNEFRSIFQSFGVKSDWFVVPPPAPPPPPPTTAPPTTAPPTTAPPTTAPPPPPPAGAFSDTGGHAHAASIEKVAAAGIATGYPDGTFRPDGIVTRGQMATFLTRGYALNPAASPTFTDIAGDAHEASIRAVAAADIARGYDDGSYRPATPLNRGQMAVFLARAEALAPVDGTGGCDVDGHGYEGQIRAVIAAGIALGDADGCFHPDEPVTRGQMSTFIARALGL